MVALLQTKTMSALPSTRSGRRNWLDQGLEGVDGDAEVMAEAIAGPEARQVDHHRAPAFGEAGQTLDIVEQQPSRCWRISRGR